MVTRAVHEEARTRHRRALLGVVAAMLAASVPTPTLGADPAPAGGSFSPAGSLDDARYDHTSTSLADGSVLVVGGDDGATLGSVERWDPVTGSFGPTGSLAQPRKWHTATLVDGAKRVLVIGGFDDHLVNEEAFLTSAELWEPATSMFGAAGAMADARIHHTATLLLDGGVLVVGGVVVSIVPLASAEVWDPISGSFEATGSLAEARSNHTATLLGDGRVLIAGGGAFTPDDFAVHASAEIWDPTTGSFGPAGSLAEGRIYHTATRLLDGRVLFVGGVARFANGWSVLSSAEVWDPTTGSFSPAGSLTGARLYHTATLLPDGRVLIAGGGDGDRELIASAELWDPVIGGFVPAGSLTGARLKHTASLLPDGRVLIVGGRGADPTPLASAELWAPLTHASAPADTHVVHVVVDGTEVRLDPTSVHAGDVDFVLDFPADQTQHAPEGLFFVSRGGDPHAPTPLTEDDVARLLDGTADGLALEGGWGTAPMRMSLAAGRYAFIVRSAEEGAALDPSRSVVVLDVLP